MAKDNFKKEKNDFIIKYEKKDVEETISSVLGDDFREYRKNFKKTQSYETAKSIPDFPVTLYVELVNRCNLNCIMCYKAHHAQPRAEMSLETYGKIMDECKKNKLPALSLSLGSEILLHKDIKKIMEMTGEAKILDTFFGSNGVLMNEEIAELIMKNKFTRVEVSLDAATQETYAKIRRGSPGLDVVEKNING
ncbi:MAG: radical SAM protein [Candidatus Pacebacteria bacterium]|nr:radical SAM protein [Candidatus Paceibacterota bacterium]